jgi:TonB family protein
VFFHGSFEVRTWTRPNIGHTTQLKANNNMPSNRRPMARLRSSFLLVLSLVLFSASGFSQQLEAQTSSTVPSAERAVAEWDRYTVRDRDFSVLLPTAPAMSTYSKAKPDPFSKINLRNLIGVYSEGVVYSIKIFERRQSLEDFIEEFGRGSAGEFKREVKVSGIGGKEYAFHDDTRKVRTQYFITTRYIYVFGALGSVLGNPDKGMPRFFESIVLKPTDGGIAIVDGAGIPTTEEPPKSAAETEARVFTGREVTRKVIVVSKPEPTYSESGRMNQVTGTVVLRAVFSSSGAVTSLRVRSGLPDGLTERALAAAKQIKFIPAIKDGNFVSTHIQLEYNFNLY